MLKELADFTSCSPVVLDQVYFEGEDFNIRIRESQTLKFIRKGAESFGDVSVYPKRGKSFVIYSLKDLFQLFGRS